jgi:ectoine hydroxylase-related dioxygenase (phytanoyl-CoA dioxygenase family)
MDKHPFNTDFEWRDHSGPYRIISEEQARQYDEQGFFVFEDAFDAETMRQLIEVIDPVEEMVANVVREKLGGKAFIMRSDEITFATHIVNKAEFAREFTRSAFFRDLTHDLLGPDVRLYWDQSVYKKPGTQDVFPWHQDNGYTYVEPQHYLTCWVSLTDADEENGCPMVCPSVHRGGTLAHEMTDLGWDCVGDEDVAAVATPVGAGSVVVFSSLTPHMTVPNVTPDRTRKSYIVQFAPDGAEVLTEKDGEIVRTVANVEDRQYWVLRNGASPH